MLVLGIETSCDETSVAVVKDGTEVLSSVQHSQVKFHEKYGGVVPELGARMHVENIGHVYNSALETADISYKNIDLVAVTTEPGLAPALNCGVAFAKGLSASLRKPLVKINHIMAHAYSLYLKQALPTPKKYPIVVLTVSGGHTQLSIFESPTECKVVGRTVDDSAGECFDKVARMLNLGYPGGPAIEKAAIEGDEFAVDFPRPMLNSGDYNFSFSGLKTAVLYHIRDTLKVFNPAISEDYTSEIERFATYDIAASLQSAIVDVLVEKSIDLAKEMKITQLGIAGGVSANTKLREIAIRRGSESGIDVFFPELKYCTDNAAMVAGLGYHCVK